MTLYVGTSGYAYKEWKGTFYPKDLSDKQMLRYYGERFRTVEINNTFYRMPKASQRITHFQRLKDSGETLGFLLQVAGALKQRMGPLLFQLHPNMKKDVGRLRDFLTLFPKTVRPAFEFRHQSWFDDEVFDLL